MINKINYKKVQDNLEKNGYFVLNTQNDAKKLEITIKLQMAIIFLKRSMHNPLLNRGK